MIRNWKALGYPAIMLAAFTAGPVMAAPEDEDKTPATAKDVKEIKEILRAMDQAVGKDVQLMKQQIAELQKDVEGMKKGGLTAVAGPTIKEMEELKQQIAKLQQTIDAINKRLPQTTTALRPANATGRLELVNDYPYQIDFVVNDSAYPVAPGMTRVVNLPVGASFNYRIPSIAGYQGNRTRSLDGERPFVIRVYPVQ